jgi:hypothetical protein
LVGIKGYLPKNTFGGTAFPAYNLAYSRGCHFRCDFCAIS